jgi:energy-coupling factor transporter ATP-binding protein EcfA2
MAGRDFRALSGGERQRALVARALIRRPTLLILDEPTNNLDPGAEEALLELLAELNRTERLTLLVVTHDLALAAHHATHVALAADGTIAAGPARRRPHPGRAHARVRHRRRLGGRRRARRVVIAEFADSWALFHNAYLVGWLLAITLSAIGVLVVARDQIFIGAAVSQASVLGIAIVLRAGPTLAGARLSRAPTRRACSRRWPSRHRRWPRSSRRGRARTAARRTSADGLGLAPRRERGDPRRGAQPARARGGAPRAVVEHHRRVASDVWLFAGLALLTLGAIALRSRALVLVAIDPAMAAAVGLRVRAWAATCRCGSASSWGSRSTWRASSTRSAASSCRRSVARNLCREVRSMFVVAPSVGVAGASRLRAREPLGLPAGADDGRAPLRRARGERARPALLTVALENAGRVAYGGAP